MLKDERSRKLAFNVLSSMVVKVISMVVTLALMPISLQLTDKTTYGVWLTLSSVILWLNFFDMGLSNGLTNKLSSSFALGETLKARKFLSTTYFLLLLILIPICFIFIPVSFFVDWNSIFNTQLKPEVIRSAVWITFASFCLTFLLKPLIDLLKASQQHFVISIIQVAANLGALFLIWLWGPSVENKFLFMCMSLAFSFPISLLIASLIFYQGRFRSILPSFSFVSMSFAKEIFGISTKFLIIQLSVLTIFTSNNFLISSFVGNDYVTYYNFSYRLFSIIIIFQTMIMTPLWPAFTDAYTLKDFNWIRNVISKSNKLNFLLLIPLLGMLIFSSTIYWYWVGPDILIPPSINYLLAIFVSVSIFKETYVSFINGSGRLNLQVLYSITTIAAHYPLAYLFSKVLLMGINGILLLNIIWVLLGFILWKIQYHQIISKEKQNWIWN